MLNQYVGEEEHFLEKNKEQYYCFDRDRVQLQLMGRFYPRLNKLLSWSNNNKIIT